MPCIYHTLSNGSTSNSCSLKLPTMLIHFCSMVGSFKNFGLDLNIACYCWRFFLFLWFFTPSWLISLTSMHKWASFIVPSVDTILLSFLNSYKLFMNSLRSLISISPLVFTSISFITSLMTVRSKSYTIYINMDRKKSYMLAPIFRRIAMKSSNSPYCNFYLNLISVNFSWSSSRFLYRFSKSFLSPSVFICTSLYSEI